MSLYLSIQKVDLSGATADGGSVVRIGKGAAGVLSAQLLQIGGAWYVAVLYRSTGLK